MLNADDARRTAERWIDSWNRRDLDAIMAHYADDVVLTSPLVVRRLGRPDGTIAGAMAVRAYFAQGLDSAPNLRFELEDVLVGVDGITILYRRDNGARATDVVLLDERGRVTRARSFYSPAIAT